MILDSRTMDTSARRDEEDLGRFVLQAADWITINPVTRIETLSDVNGAASDKLALHGNETRTRCWCNEAASANFAQVGEVLLKFALSLFPFDTARTSEYPLNSLVWQLEMSFDPCFFRCLKVDLISFIFEFSSPYLIFLHNFSWFFLGRFYFLIAYFRILFFIFEFMNNFVFSNSTTTSTALFSFCEFITPLFLFIFFHSNNRAFFRRRKFL